jgi:hypothetical protein
MLSGAIYFVQWVLPVQGCSDRPVFVVALLRRESRVESFVGGYQYLAVILATDAVKDSAAKTAQGYFC